MRRTDRAMNGEVRGGNFWAAVDKWAVKTESLVLLCATLATQREFETLRAVRRKYSTMLNGYLLHILECVPETTPLDEYKDLLRAAVGKEAVAAEPEAPDRIAPIVTGDELPPGVPARPLVNGIQLRPADKFPPEPERDVSWITKRAESIDANTGLLYLARDLVRFCKNDLEISGLDSLCNDVECCCMLLYDRNAADLPSFRNYRKLSGSEKLKILFTGLGSDKAFIEACNGPALPLLTQDSMILPSYLVDHPECGLEKLLALLEFQNKPGAPKLLTEDALLFMFPTVFDRCQRGDRWEMMQRIVNLIPEKSRDNLDEKLLLIVKWGLHFSSKLGLKKCYSFYDQLAKNVEPFLDQVKELAIMQRLDDTEWNILKDELPKCLDDLEVSDDVRNQSPLNAAISTCFEGMIMAKRFELAKGVMSRVPDSDKVVVKCERTFLSQCTSLRNDNVTAAWEAVQLLPLRHVARREEEVFIKRLNSLAKLGLNSLKPSDVRALFEREDYIHELGVLLLRIGKCPPNKLVDSVKSVIEKMNQTDTLELELLAAEEIFKKGISKEVVDACLGFVSKGFIPAGNLVRNVLEKSEGRALSPEDRRVLAGFCLRHSIMTLNGNEQQAVQVAERTRVAVTGCEADSIQKTLDLCCTLAARTVLGRDISSPYAILSSRANDIEPEDLIAATARYIPSMSTYNLVLSFLFRALSLLSHSDAGSSTVTTRLSADPVTPSEEPKEYGKYSAHVQALLYQRRFAEVAHQVLALVNGLDKLVGDFSYGKFCDSGRADYRRHFMTRMINAKEVNSELKKKLLPLAEQCGFDDTELQVETAVSVLVEAAQAINPAKISDEKILSMAAQAKADFSSKCQPHLTKMVQRDAAYIVLRLCEECYLPLEYQVELCSLIGTITDCSEPTACPKKQPEYLVKKRGEEQQKFVAMRDTLPDDKMKEAFTLICLQRDKSRREASFAMLCEDCLRHSMKLNEITAIGECLAWPASQEEIINLVVSLFHSLLPLREGSSSISPLCCHIVNACSLAKRSVPFEAECEKRVLDVAAQYLSDTKAPTPPRIELSTLLFKVYNEKTLKEHGINFTTLDLELFPMAQKLCPDLPLDKLQSPKIGDSRGVAEYAKWLLTTRGTIDVSPVQMKTLGDVLLFYQKQAEEPALYTEAWSILFHRMVEVGMQQYIIDIRKRCISALCTPPLSQEDENKLRMKIPENLLKAFDDTSPYTESGANAAAQEGARQNMLDASTRERGLSGSGAMLGGSALVAHYRERISAHNFKDMTEVNPRIFSRCIRSIRNSTSGQRRALLHEAGGALLESEQTISAALIHAEYDRIPAFLRTTAAVGAINAYYYPEACDDHQ